MLRMTMVLLCLCTPLAARDYDTAPTLANPGGTTVVSVSTVSALQNAVANIADNQIIEVADGTYTLTQSLFFNGAATVTRTNIGIRSASRNPAACIIQGNGMSSSSGTIPHGIHVSKTSTMLIADLTIRNVYYHAIQIAGETGVSNVRIYNCRLLDTGEQFIKGSASGYAGGSDNGIVEYTLMRYTAQGTTYTNGVDIHGGDGWIIRHNRFELVNLVPGGVGPAVLMWNGSSNTTCEGNTFINCETAIALGLIDRTAPQTDHAGGVIRNNFIYRAGGTPTGVDTPDCSILIWDSPNTKCLNNTIIQSGSFANGIEYRFSTTGAEIRFNLLDCAVTDRGGGTSANTVSNNVSNAQASWFIAASSGDLRLSATAPASVVNAATTHASVSDDYDGNARPAGTAPDMGACEDNATPPAPTAPSAPTNCSAVAQAGLQISVSWTDASNNEDGFRLERSVSGGAFATLTTLGAGATSYLDTGLTDGTQYTYRVIASNTVGDSAASNSASATATVSAPVGGGTGGTSGGGGGCSAGETGGVLLLVLAAASLALRRKRAA
jgi:hypothetical protein